MNAFGFIISIVTLVMTFGLLCIRLTHPAYKDKPLFQSNKVKRPDPKINMPEPGICQCSDALCFHKMGGQCEIVGCPCQMFIPSDANNTMLSELGNGVVAKMALEAMSHELQFRETQNKLETTRTYR